MAIMPRPHSVGPLGCSLRKTEQNKSVSPAVLTQALYWEAGYLRLWMQENRFIVERGGDGFSLKASISVRGLTMINAFLKTI